LEQDRAGRVARPWPEGAPMSGVRVLVGTRKGAFVLNSDGQRERWDVSGPHFGGWEIYHVKGSPADPDRLFASQSNGWFGQLIQRSDDGGRTWEPVGNKFSYDGEPGTHQWYDGTPHPWEFARVWHLEPSLNDPDTVYAGVEDAGLFRSADGGQSWQELPGLRTHPSGPGWQPGAGGMCLHTIIEDPGAPGRMFAAISAAGAFRSDDGGVSWTPKNAGVRADFLPDKFPAVGQCVHHMEMHPQRPEVLYQQNHCGVYRSDDGGDSWNDISNGLPSRFGFPFATLPHDGDTVFVIPEESDQARMTADARFGIYRSRNRGESWDRLTNGLPQSGAYLNVMRMAMTTDPLDAPGVYVGTQGGHLLASRDGGDSWQVVFNWLPPVYSLETAVV
jgi:photosystem II stability/assembly factor-like uncharacterized protein